MALRTSQVFLYAATEGDFYKCLAAAQSAGIPSANCIGDFSQAFQLAMEANSLVIAVGGAALNALYYNPCGWPNPAGTASGSTPFTAFATGLGIDRTQANQFVNAAGFTALDSLKLAVMLAYYAVHGTFPAQFSGLPTQEVPKSVCVAGASANVVLSKLSAPMRGSATPTDPSTSSVGLYAAFASAADVRLAIAGGWPGLAVTGGLGTPTAPYTGVLSQQPDRLVAEGIDAHGGSVWWLSIWTVSWPTSGDSFYNAGYEGGKYVASVIQNYGSTYRPNYVVLDPEGYNSPATQHAEWAEFVHGWSDGLATSGESLTAAFYCDQSQYTTYTLADVAYPAFIAVSPIEGNRPFASGSNIKGYLSCYGTCPVNADVTQVAGWGGLFNTIQFRDSGVDCARGATNL